MNNKDKWGEHKSDLEMMKEAVTNAKEVKVTLHLTFRATKAVGLRFLGALIRHLTRNLYFLPNLSITGKSECFEDDEY